MFEGASSFIAPLFLLNFNIRKNIMGNNLNKTNRPAFAWLNEDSNTFLQRGYLIEGKTSLDRVRDIANKAEERLGIEGYAEKFYDYMSKGWFSLSSPIWANYGIDHKGSPISCFTGDTIVLVKTEDGKKVKELMIKEVVDIADKIDLYVYSYNIDTKRNEFNLIQKAWKTKTDNVVSVFFDNGKSVECTVDHKFFTVEGLWIEAQYLKGIEVKSDEGWVKVESVEDFGKVEDVYDLTVANVHNFYVYNDNSSLLAHNCFGSYIGDSVADIVSTGAEVGMMSKIGGGTSAYFGDIRPRGSTITNNGKSDGSFNFAKLFDTTIDVISQGSSRRGMFAGYIDIEHGDIDEWLDIHTEGNPIQLMYYGVCVSDRWLNEMQAGDKYKRQIWAKLLQRKTETGIPYIFFKDNVNNGKPEVYKDQNMTIHASNLCVEVALPSSSEESFVCCLSSMNLLYFDEWKDTDAPIILTYFLDTVMTEFIEKEKDTPFMEKAVRFAERHRALGLGVLGYHSYLQSKMIPFDSFEAMEENKRIFKLLQEKTLKASQDLAEMFGEPEVLKGYGRRNTTLMAIAPTKSSSAILGQVSPSIEPFKSNYFVKDLAKIKTLHRNPFLEDILIGRGYNTEEVWDSILKYNGSVQHLDFLTREEKEVFKTFEEISQLAIIQQAAQRQKYIDQGQSLNITIHPSTPAKDINQLYLTAWKLGVKSIYYQFSVNAAQAFNRDLLTCSSCEA